MVFSADQASSSDANTAAWPEHVDLRLAYEAAGIQAVLDQLDRELIGLKPVKARIREIAALLVVNRA